MNQRRTSRYKFRMKAKVQPVGTGASARPVGTWTRDVSSQGLFLELKQPWDEGMRMRLTLHLPAEITGHPVQLGCISRVVRVVGEGNRKVGVGAVIESYELVRRLEAAQLGGARGFARSLWRRFR